MWPWGGPFVPAWLSLVISVSGKPSGLSQEHTEPDLPCVCSGQMRCSGKLSVRSLFSR